jgi:hypothetical protein
LRRPHTALGAAFVALGLSAQFAPAQQMSRASGPDNDPARSSSAIDPELANRSARYLMRNGIDYLNYQEYTRALRFLRAAEARDRELSGDEIRQIKTAIQRAQSGLREPAPTARNSRTRRPGALAAARPSPSPSQPSANDGIQLAAATRTDDVRIPPPAEANSAYDMDREPSAVRTSAPAMTPPAEAPSDRAEPRRSGALDLPPIRDAAPEPIPDVPAGSPARAPSQPAPAEPQTPAPLPDIPPASGAPAAFGGPPSGSNSKGTDAIRPTVPATIGLDPLPPPAANPAPSSGSPLPSIPELNPAPAPPTGSLPPAIPEPTPTPSPSTGSPLPAIPEPTPKPEAPAALPTPMPSPSSGIPDLPPVRASADPVAVPVPSQEPAPKPAEPAAPLPALPDASAPKPADASSLPALPDLPPARPSSLPEPAPGTPTPTPTPPPSTEPAPATPAPGPAPTSTPIPASDPAQVIPTPTPSTGPLTELPPLPSNEPAPAPAPVQRPAATPSPADEASSATTPRTATLPAAAGSSDVDSLPTPRPHSPADEAEIARVAERQERGARPVLPPELNRTLTPPVTGTQVPINPGDVTSSSSSRFIIERAPSPTEAWPIRRIPVPDEFVQLPKRDFAPSRKYWQAPAMCHMPLYFQDAALERYGHSVENFLGPSGRYLTYPIDDPKQSKLRFQILQPAFSAGLMAFQIGTLPYKLLVDPPWEAEYDLGYYRPGDRVPTDVFYLPVTGVGPPFHGKNY